MQQFHAMLHRITSSKFHDSMIQFAAPLKEYFGINHFWYYKITYSGYYSYIGTHTDWSHYCFENHLVDQFPCLKDPDSQVDGIALMKNTNDLEYRKLLDDAWTKFRINFSLNHTTKIPDGVEAFGFATEHNHPMNDEMLINELPLLINFSKVFREKHQGLFALLDETQVDFATYLGAAFNKKQKRLRAPKAREELLDKLNLLPTFLLTKREKEVLKFVANGYPASYIATRLFLSKRTVENYLDTIKGKLMCASKVELIDKSKELVSIGYLDDKTLLA